MGSRTGASVHALRGDAGRVVAEGGHGGACVGVRGRGASGRVRVEGAVRVNVGVAGIRGVAQRALSGVGAAGT